MRVLLADNALLQAALADVRSSLAHERPSSTSGAGAAIALPTARLMPMCSAHAACQAMHQTPVTDHREGCFSVNLNKRDQEGASARPQQHHGVHLRSGVVQGIWCAVQGGESLNPGSSQHHDRPRARRALRTARGPRRQPAGAQRGASSLRSTSSPCRRTWRRSARCSWTMPPSSPRHAPAQTHADVLSLMSHCQHRRPEGTSTMLGASDVVAQL